MAVNRHVQGTGHLQRIVWLGSALAVLLIALAIVVWRNPAPPVPADLRAAASPPVAPRPAAAASPPATQEAPAKPPSFDIVSVDPNGHAVIAGRAAAGDRVTVLDGDKKLGEATADRRGEWVLVPEKALPAGNRQLSAEAAGRDGGAPRRSEDVVALSVTPPAAGAGETATLAVVLPGAADGAARVLQRPEPAAGAPALALETAEYDQQDRLMLSGRAGPGAQLNVYAGNRLLGTVSADAAGKWKLASSYRNPGGAIELRLDELSGDGGVIRRVVAPFSLPPGVMLQDGDTYVVQRGNNLWVIARRIYGDGLRYTAIYDANRNQIRDPDWIYPGQRFKLPKS
jgi:nucleoid-associated protein YgaU